MFIFLPLDVCGGGICVFCESFIAFCFLLRALEAVPYDGAVVSMRRLVHLVCL